ncbi:MAG: class I SAM-dependent methyltransferase [Oscillospiraceae bacterium]|nr:class I SAM-dependent methyltransferase [Oscillospiraceae bacterium]
MKADYKNWMPKGMIYGFGAASAVLAASATAVSFPCVKGNCTVKTAVSAVLGTAAAGCAAWTAWCVYAYSNFSYEGKRQLSKEIIEGTAAYVSVPEGGRILDVGCGSGALAIACAKRNPDAFVTGVDKWGPEYASFNQKRCEDNAEAEGVTNVTFQKGDACKLDFPDETFDAVTSNYVYHNIMGVDKQDLLRETLRVLKKGGTFAIHDLMGKARYGDMDKFVAELRAEGFEEVHLIPTADGTFMNKAEAVTMLLADSMLLVGKK